MKPSEIRKVIRDGQTGPLYLLGGDDLQSRHDLALEFGALVDEELHAFNVQSLYATEATSTGARDALIASILGAARTLPMMSPRRVVLVHEAERLLSPKKSKEDDAEMQPELPGGPKRKRSVTPAEELEAYFEHPEPMTTLVFVAGELDANRRLVKVLRRHGVSVDCGTLEDDREADAWIERRLDKDELKIEPKALVLLRQATGRNLGRIRAEVEKLVLYCSGEPAVTVQHVRDLVMPQIEASEDVFALANAIQNANAVKALREIDARIDAGSPPFLLLGQVRLAVGRLSPDVRVRNGLAAVFEADLAMKSSIGEPRHVLECLVVQLCGR